MRLADLNRLDDGAAVEAFLRCCGSSRWARQMSAARPFADAATMAAAAERIGSTLEPRDWLEAFAAHPRIGADRGSGAGKAESLEWSAQEQARVAFAGHQTRARLAEANHDYETRFGYIFIVCATGKTGEEMLALLERRLRHDPADELGIAAGEQQKITRLRLTKLLDEQPDTIS